ncbi:hypothetical protein [Draconibacterium mangrovi]|uniref:hypothetical protein n=1 Tax=Draconibacterium mangrovi TaxID=2697469 RepID=UPI0013D3B64E|nr:hypothetical protein [Draconibacterium mangrovi]
MERENMLTHKGQSPENICYLTEDGEVLWNEVMLINELSHMGMRKIVIPGEYMWVMTDEYHLTHFNFQEIKNLVLDLLNKKETQTVRKFLLWHDKFFSPRVLNGLLEEIPDFEQDDHLIFLRDKKKISVYYDGEIVMKEEAQDSPK